MSTKKCVTKRKNVVLGVVLGVLSIVCAGVLVMVLIFNQLTYLPQKDLLPHEAPEVFEKLFHEADAILQSYGIDKQFELYEDDAIISSDSTYIISKSVDLDNGYQLSVTFYSRDWQHPSIMLSLKTPFSDNRAESIIKPEDHPYFYELATHFGCKKYTTEQRIKVSNKVINRAMDEIEDERSDAHYTSGLKCLFTEIVTVSFDAYAFKRQSDAVPYEYNGRLVIQDYLYL